MERIFCRACHILNRVSLLRQYSYIVRKKVLPMCTVPYSKRIQHGDYSYSKFSFALTLKCSLYNSFILYGRGAL